MSSEPHLSQYWEKDTCPSLLSRYPEPQRGHGCRDPPILPLASTTIIYTGTTNPQRQCRRMATKVLRTNTLHATFRKKPVCLKPKTIHHKATHARLKSISPRDSGMVCMALHGALFEHMPRHLEQAGEELSGRCKLCVLLGLGKDRGGLCFESPARIK